jgi:hypothetical protein
MLKLWEFGSLEVCRNGDEGSGTSGYTRVLAPENIDRGRSGNWLTAGVPGSRPGCEARNWGLTIGHSFTNSPPVSRRPCLQSVTSYNNVETWPQTSLPRTACSCAHWLMAGLVVLRSLLRINLACAPGLLHQASRQATDDRSGMSMHGTLGLQQYIFLGSQKCTDAIKVLRGSVVGAQLSAPCIIICLTDVSRLQHMNLTDSDQAWIVMASTSVATCRHPCRFLLVRASPPEVMPPDLVRQDFSSDLVHWISVS